MILPLLGGEGRGEDERETNTTGRKFEDGVKSTQDAAVLVLVY